eukprot:6807200-Pyramimonas_sp.AAC.1
MSVFTGLESPAAALPPQHDLRHPAQAFLLPEQDLPAAHLLLIRPAHLHVLAAPSRRGLPPDLLLQRPQAATS